MRDSLPTHVTSYLETADDGKRMLHDSLVSLGSEGTYSKYLAQAGPKELAAFFADLGRTDLDWVAQHRQALLSQNGQDSPGELTPVEPDRISGPAVENLHGAGRASLAQGHWSALVFSGGAATRFFSGMPVSPHEATPPKGLYPVTPVMGFSFLERFAAQGLAAGVQAGRMPYLILMTSHLTEAPLRKWATTAPLWGHPRDVIVILTQAEHPRLDGEGDLISHADGHLLFTGDGHGGVFRALFRPDSDGTSLASRLSSSDVRHLVLHNVDNAAANAFHGARLGYHVRADNRLTLCVVPRERPDEKVGLVVRNDRSGRIECVEYSVCPKEMAEAVAPDGSPRFSLAHICTNLVDLESANVALGPVLYTGKRVQVGDREVESSTYEMLNQDLSQKLDARDVGVLQLDRDSFFLPTKSRTGPDSLESTMRSLAVLGIHTLEEQGARVHDSALVEIDPCMGVDIGPDWKVAPGARIYLGVRHGPEGGSPFSPGLSVGEDASFKVSAALPYGRLDFDPSSRAIREDPESAGRVHVGRHVTVAPGADVEIVVEGGGCLIVPDGSSLEGRVRERVHPGESKTLSS